MIGPRASQAGLPVSAELQGRRPLSDQRSGITQVDYNYDETEWLRCGSLDQHHSQCEILI